MALNQFTNNAGTTLASGITNSATSLTVSTGSGALFPTLTGSQYFYCTLQQASGGALEIVKVTARSTDTFTIVRAQDGTTALSFVTGDYVQLRLTAADLNNFGQLDSTNTWASAQTFSAAPIITPLTGLLYGNASSALTAATAAQVVSVIGSTAVTNATNVTGTVGVANGGTGLTSTTAYGVLAGGTTTTGALQNIGTGTTGQILTSNGPGVLPSFQAAASSGFTNMQVFTSPGTFTTPSSTTKIKVTVVGGGGAGSNAVPGTGTGAGGGGGGAAIYVGPVTASTPYAITVGTAGNTSSFGSLASATGGGGGSGAGTGGAGGAGGAGSAGTLQLKGGGGGTGTVGIGGPSYLGGGGNNGIFPSGSGSAGGQYGGGGGGGNQPAGTGGAGAAGVVVVEY